MKKKINKIKIGNINDLLEDESQYNGDYKLSKSASRLFDKINNEKQISDLEFEEKNLSADEELADEPLKELGVNFKTFNKLQKVKPIRNPLTWVAKSTSNDIDDEEIVLTVDPSKYDGLKKKNIDLKQNDYNVAENNDFIFADEPDLSQEFDIEKEINFDEISADISFDDDDDEDYEINESLRPTFTKNVELLKKYDVSLVDFNIDDNEKVEIEEMDGELYIEITKFKPAGIDFEKFTFGKKEPPKEKPKVHLIRREVNNASFSKVLLKKEEEKKLKLIEKAENILERDNVSDVKTEQLISDTKIGENIINDEDDIKISKHKIPKIKSKIKTNEKIIDFLKAVKEDYDSNSNRFVNEELAMFNNVYNTNRNNLNFSMQKNKDYVENKLYFSKKLSSLKKLLVLKQKLEIKLLDKYMSNNPKANISIENFIYHQKEFELLKKIKSEIIANKKELTRALERYDKIIARFKIEEKMNAKQLEDIHNKEKSRVEKEVNIFITKND